LTQQPADVPELEPGQYASLVAGASDEQLEEGLRQNRELLLGEVFRRMPEHFRSDKAGDLKAVVEWRIEGREDGGHDRYQLVIENGSCELVEDGGHEPTVSMTLGSVDFIRLITGNANGPMLFTFGKLKIKGDLLLAARLQSFFQMPRAEGGEQQASEGGEQQASEGGGQQASEDGGQRA
jgi:putative sterol carrier protein